MKIGIMGAGGLGGYIGGWLAHEGHDVAFIARGKHLQAILETGLRVQSPFGDFTIQAPNATDDPEKVGPVDLILFSVKSYDAVEAIEKMKPMVGPGRSFCRSLMASSIFNSLLTISVLAMSWVECQCFMHISRNLA